MDMISTFKAIKSKTWFIPAAVLLAGVVIIVAIMTGCGDKDIDLVKKGVFPDDSLRTVEQRITARHKKVKWTSYTTKKNYKVVEATAVVRLTDADERKIRREMRNWKIKREEFVCDGDIYAAKFVINADHKSFGCHGESVKGPYGENRNWSAAKFFVKLPTDKTGFVPKQD